MEKVYERPQILETMPIEDILMDEELAPEWINWKQSWNNGWNNSGVIPQTAEKLTEGGEKR
ncbi:MAG: hypothetical protein ACUVWN_11530 [bacterium]